MHRAGVFAFAITVLVTLPVFAQSESCAYTSSTLDAAVRVRPPSTPPLTFYDDVPPARLSRAPCHRGAWIAAGPELSVRCTERIERECAP
jgi:hypothetical protein